MKLANTKIKKKKKLNVTTTCKIMKSSQVRVEKKICLLFFLHAVYCNYGQRHGEGGALVLDFRKQVTFSVKKNNPLEVGEINDKDDSERGRMKEL